MGQFREAIPALKKAKAMEAPPFVTAYLAFAYGAAGDRASALAEFADLKKMSRDGTVLPFNLALVHSVLAITSVRSTTSSERWPPIRK
jgi:hypothetical protein